MSERPDFEVIDSEGYRLVYATGVFGGLAPNDGRIIFTVDRLRTVPAKGKPGREKVAKIVRERQVEIRMSPATWKGVAKWMQNHVTNLEKQFGKIPEKPKDSKEETSTGIYR